MLTGFLQSFWSYTLEIFPALVIGFLMSGVIHEFIPAEWINKHLGGKGVKGVLYSTLAGTLVPVCCWGCLPIAVSFRKKGASLGSILAMLVATPATSINALIVTERFFGIGFAAYLFFSVIIMGITIGLIGNKLKFNVAGNDHECCCSNNHLEHESRIVTKKPFFARSVSVLKFAFIDMPRDIGKETLLGLILAALVSAAMPVGFFVKEYLVGGMGYLFANILGLLMYMCATMGVPLVDALVKQGMEIGAGFVLLLVGPITSYGTILVLKKEFGLKVLAVYLGSICLLATIFGYIYSLLV
ncbi:MAG: hypothetical protein A3G33_10425 [Omnitrophica bacterium RIFCSPLOWO2_12_FULL_44_17]|uniref:Permease n=1 Tax=Candidatus Danuiimicrobium aquiferis TaxID=1801832 RepID=A0A1G1KR06_9BACT|nr:MAG: hypothetical protein A3B72_02740 [Omnitrophica bacterium RIFCSPHIGHO2_02_FULL_45_28]OGW91154.1 MAG: hypothetical protein A3E74_09155 [Omnitrophica bacterium RIFCSPHIGHO2_12_FULL_44_12]OGW95390.1 MAG: hypothetical protein A3G33_10425 [Omnitrophica bacterium RIFCSPLOWO2_12_FULL_44_17]OGX03276.1 MAG: hypothetical protein A3J12_07060 [Omnitrophica bacterium RIFCSPLOWO2_02_FULL_44_11]